MIKITSLCGFHRWHIITAIRAGCTRRRKASATQLKHLNRRWTILACPTLVSQTEARTELPPVIHQVRPIASHLNRPVKVKNENDWCVAMLTADQSAKQTSSGLLEVNIQQSHFHEICAFTENEIQFQFSLNFQVHYPLNHETIFLLKNAPHIWFTMA